MALILCDECKAEISSKALSCPKCGSPLVREDEIAIQEINGKKNGFLFFIGNVIILGVILFVGSFIFENIFPNKMSNVVTNEAFGIHASDTISLSDSAYGCQYEGRLAEATRHYEVGEYAAWANIIYDEPSCFNKKTLKNQNQKWTVLQIKGNLMQITTSGIGDEKRYGRNYWALAASAVKE